MKELRQWQKDLFDKWASNNYFGCCLARTGSGKTLAGIACIAKYRQLYPSMKLLVIVPSAKIAKQWYDDLSEYGLEDTPIYSYTQAINKMNRAGLTADCLILDECHRVSPEKQSAGVMKLNPKHVLGLSATPGGSVMTLGKPFFKVDWDEAQLCPFYIHYTLFAPTARERQEYDRQTTSMQRYAMDHTRDGKKSMLPGADKRYDWMARNRRAFTYEMPSRVTHAVRCIIPYAKAGKRTIVYAERNDTLKAIAEELTKEGIKWSVCSQWMDTLKDFEEKRTNVLLLAKKLREGWNDVTLEVEVLVSPTTRELSHTQVVGRVCRQDPDNPGKHAHVIALLASLTSDENLITHNDFPPSQVETVTIDNLVAVCPGLTDRQMVTKLL